jgi:hypothetical protein
MRIRIRIDKAAALKAGNDRHGLAVVEVPAAELTAEQREALARLANPPGTRHGHEPEADFYLDAVTSPLADGLPALADDGRVGVLAVLDRLAANVREQAAERAEKDRQEAARKADKEAGLAALRRWAEASGSELLRARIADGYEWRGLGEREYVADVVESLRLALPGAETPGGYELGESGDRTTPTLAEIWDVRSARKAAAGKPAEVELRWVTYRRAAGDDHPDDGGGEIQRAELVVTVTCPTGRRVESSFLAGAADPALA